MKVKISAYLIITALLTWTNGFAFDLNALKKLGEDLQKSMPQQLDQTGSSTPVQSTNTGTSLTQDPPKRSSNSGTLSFCESEDSVFGFSGYTTTNLSGSPESIVAEYFDIDPTLAELQLREHLFTIRPIIGVTFPEVITDGGMWSGEARSRGIELIMDPSLTTLAQVIQAAKQEKKGFGAVDIQVPESKLVMALVAIQLEPLLKDKSLPGLLLKESRKSGKYAGGTSVKSRLAYAMSARWELIQQNNQQLFDSYIIQSGDNQSLEFSSTSFVAGRTCKLCFDTIDWAAAGGIPNWQFAPSVEQFKQMRDQMFGSKPSYNPPNWDANVTALRAQAQSLNSKTAGSFESAKGQSRSEAKGAEAARISRESQNTYGGVPDSELDQAISIMQTQTPRYMEADKKEALATALRERMVLVNDIQTMQMDLLNATFSGNYSYVDIGEKGSVLNSLTRSACLVAFAERRAARASEIALPDPSDTSAEESLLR
ncbi:hypothetical protein OA099_00790 [Litorivicinus sp.]|nr:hypothetical protein [Litorivicinus sp.]